MEAQLEVWNSKIDRLAARTQKAGDRARFEDLMHIDELKALHAIAQSKLEEFRTAQATQRARLEAEIKTALEDLKAAFKNTKPSP
jgi:hypothetical protein